MMGTPLVGAIEYYLARYGRVAGHETVVRIPARWRPLLEPHAPALGVLGSRKYPYPFIGDVVRTMAAVAKVPDEDAFFRELAVAGIDASLNTAMRVLLRYASTPSSLAARGNEAWRMFHDSGHVTAVATEGEYLATTSEWANHDVVVCKVVMEVRRRLIERTGKSNVIARREKCLAWGHDVCSTRIRWGNSPSASRFER